MTQEMYLAYYCYPGCEPLKNIMRLPENEAFALAEKLWKEHPDTTAFYRFGDFENYYPRRLRTDALLYERFCALGGQPEDTHPLSFVLDESDYLYHWFSEGKPVRIPLDSIREEIISFTPGDSMSTLDHEGDITLLTLPMLKAEAKKHGGITGYLQHIRKQYHYMEVQVWGNVCLPEGEAK